MQYIAVAYLVLSGQIYGQHFLPHGDIGEQLCNGLPPSPKTGMLQNSCIPYLFDKLWNA